LQNKTVGIVPTVFFSPREREVFNLILEGYSMQRIREHLDMSISGIRWHRANMLLRNNCASVPELIAKFHKGSDGNALEIHDIPENASVTVDNNSRANPGNTQQHIKGADEIAKVFGVSRATVIKWVKKGAPIRIIGKKYQANYGELWEWLKQ